MQKRPSLAGTGPLDFRSNFYSLASAFDRQDIGLRDTNQPGHVGADLETLMHLNLTAAVQDERFRFRGSTPFARSPLFLIGWLLYGCFAIGPAEAEGDIHWGYLGNIGPDHWADLSPDFVLCKHGVNQSPINIRETIDAELGLLEFDYSRRATSVVNNGHTLQLNVEPGNWMRVEGDQFELVHIHFHSPSEHQYKGEKFPLEAHLVHQNAKGELAVVGVMFRLGEEHSDLAKIGSAAPSHVGESKPIVFDVGKMTLHASHEQYFRYSGSLTTPPCSEGVRWFILKQTSHISQQQIDNFVRLIGEDARGPQPQNARIVLQH